MNRIILIGNGFDIAHGLKTGYQDFIRHYWSEFAKEIFSKEKIENHTDEFAEFIVDRVHCNDRIKWSICNEGIVNINSFYDLKIHIESCNERLQLHCIYSRQRKRCMGHQSISLKLRCKNRFFQHISDPNSHLNIWLDVENEYYDLLKLFLDKESRDQLQKLYGWNSVQDLNNEFEAIKKLLEKYLTFILENSDLTVLNPIMQNILSPIYKNDIPFTKLQIFNDLLPDCQETILPSSTLFLNFNYTNVAERFYRCKDTHSVINIHGELNNEDNPIIFGYGDELDEDYPRLEKERNIDFSKNFKSLLYLHGDNFSRLQRFIYQGPYQILIMGHSCGNSDRTLLNTISEHPNCISIKLCYHEWGKGKDNYGDILANIAKNLKEGNVRNILANKPCCRPLIPFTENLPV